MKTSSKRFFSNLRCKLFYSALFIALQTNYLIAQNCTINAGVPLNICGNEILRLEGTAAGSFQDPVNPVTWTQISGPSVLVLEPHNLGSVVLGKSAGDVLKFRLSATCEDGSFVYTEVTHSVLPITQANAGPDQVICPGTYNLSANSPNTGAGEVGEWLIIGEGNNLTIADITDPNTEITVPEGNSGVTELIWTIASSNECNTSDRVTITNLGGVMPVNAGPDQNLGNCFSISQSTNLQGTYGGDMTGGQQGTWTIVSGPNIPNIVNIHNNDTRVNNLIEGTYVFQWSVEGLCAEGEDQVTITVPAPTADITNAGGGQSKTFCDSRTEVVLEAPAPIYTNETVQWIQTGGPTAGVAIINPTNNITAVQGLDGTSNYSFQYTISNAVTNCTSSAAYNINYADQPTLNIIPSTLRLACGQTVASVDYESTGDGAISWRIVSGPTTPIYSTIPTNFIQANSNPQLIYGLSVSGTYVVEFRKVASTGSQCETVFDAVTIVTSKEPGLASVGTEQLLACNVYSTELTGNIPSEGIGTWSQISGPNTAIISDIYANNTTVSGLINGTYYFRWIISGGAVCNANEIDTKVVVADLQPTQANAGPDQENVCIQTPIYLDANPPVLNETGLWTISPNVSGESFEDPTNAKTILNGLIDNETYTLTWTIKNSCGTTSDEMVITTTSTVGPIAADAGPDDCFINGTTVFGLNGNNPSPGTGNWTFISGPNTPTITNPALFNTTVTGAIDGTYIFRWEISFNSCSSTTDEVMISISPETSDADAGIGQNICGSSVVLNATAPTVGTGVWRQIAGAGGVEIIDPLDPQTTVNLLSSGTYKFEWTVSNDACAINSDTVVVNISTPPVIANAGPDQDLCGTTTATMAANSVSNGVWSLISGPNFPVFDDVTSPTATVSGLLMGTYVVKWTSYGGTFCDPSEDIVTISVVPTANAGADQEYCEATTAVDLIGNLNSTGTWTEVTSFGATITSTSSNTATASNLVSGNNYIFQYTISQPGCISTDQVNVDLVQPPPFANAGADQIWCDAETFSLTGNDPTVFYTGEWLLLSSPGGGTFDNAFSQNAIFTPTPGSEYGVFLFTWKISNGECGNEDQVRVTNYQPPSTAEAGSAQNLVCDNKTIMQATNPAVGVGTWTIKSVEGDAPAPNIVSPILHNSTIDNLGPQSNGNPATYVFTWTITNGPICTPSEEDVAITVYQIPTKANAGADDEICNQTSYVLSANNPGVGTGEWINIPAGVTFSNVNSNAPTVSGLTPGQTYTFTWEVSTAFCSSTDQVVVINNEEPSTPDAMAKIEICQYGNLVLTNIAPTIGSGQWQQISGPATNILFPNLATTPVTGIVDGNTYEFRYTVSNGNCTPKSEDVIVEVYEQPTISDAGPNQQFCNQNTTTLAGNEPVTFTSAEWTVINKPAAATVTFTNPAQYNTDVSGITEPGTYTLRWTIYNGTCSSFSDMKITRYADLVTTNPTDGEICENGTHTLSVNVTGGSGTVSYQWKYSSDNITYVNVTGGSGANSRIYKTANNLSDGTHYFLVEISGCNTITSQEAIVTVNEIPVVSASNSAQEFCDGGTSAVMVLSSSVASSTYSWSRTNPAGITTTQPTTGTGNIPAAIFSNSNANPLTVTYTIYAYGPSPTTCPSAPITATIKVNATPKLSSSLTKTICSGSSVAYDITSATTGATFIWSRATIAGITEAGVVDQTSDPISETLTNTTFAPINVEYTITPTGPAPTNCGGTSETLVVTVNPTPDITATGQTICSSNAINIALSSSVTGTTFYYAAPTISGAAGNITGGTARPSPGSSASITNTLVNTTAVNQTATYTVYPIADGCVGTPIDVVITVQPEPRVANQTTTICSDEALNFTLPAGTGVAATTYNITAINLNGLTASAGAPVTGTGFASNIIADDAYTNTTNAQRNVVYTIVPVAANGCAGSSFTVTATINPEPVITNKSTATCSDVALNYSLRNLIPAGVMRTNSTFTYTVASSDPTNVPAGPNRNTGTGANITDTYTNTTSNPVLITYTIIPTSGQGCVGSAFDLVVTVNPEPVVANQTPASVCSRSAIGVSLGSSSSVAASTYNITAINSNGLTASAGNPVTGNGFSSTVLQDDAWINTTGADVNVVYSVIPVSANGCSGNTFTVTVPVKPEPVASNGTVTICSNNLLDYNLLNQVTSLQTGATFTYTVVSGDPTNVPAAANRTIASAANITDSYTNSTSSPVNVVYTITPIAANGCSGQEFTVTVTVNPEPQVNDIDDETYCTSDLATINFGTQNSGGTTTFAWTNTNTNIGLGASGTGNLSFTATNTGIAAITATIEVTPTFTNNSVACSGNPKSFTITVNPSAQVNPIADQELCNNSTTTEIVFGTDRTDGTTTYSWTNTNDAIGLAVSGSGSGIPSFTATNTTPFPIFGTIEVTPSYTNGGVSCTGSTETFTITVNPTPTVSSNSKETVCSGGTVNYTPESQTTGTTYTWVATNTVGTVTGFTASGSGPINDVLTNAGTADGEVTYVITPTGPAPTFCVGPNFSLEVKVSNCEPAIGVAKQLVNTIYNEDGTLTANFNIRVQNYGNVQLYDIQVTEDLATVFGAANYEVIRLFSTSFDVNTSFNGNGDTDLLSNSGTSNILEIGASTNIELQIKLLNPGTFNNSVEVNANSISGALSDISQNGSDPDPDGDGNPGNNNQVTPVTFGSCSLNASAILNSTCGNAAGSVTLTGSEAGTVSLNGVEKASPAIYPGLQAGWYTATFTANATGCNSKTTFEITNTNSTLTGGVTAHTDVTCNGLNNGSVTVAASGGTTPYSYRLNGVVQGTNTFSSLAPGEYSCQITDANGCTYTVSFDIDEPTTIIAQITNQINETCFDAANGSATVVASGGTTPYTYLWSNGQNTATATGLADGIYSATVTDANSCTALANVTISGAATALSIAGNASNLTCNGDNSGSIDITVSGGTSPYTYSWSNGFNAEDPTGLAAGSYTIIVTDANGCSATRAFNLTQPAALALQAGGISNTVCNSNTGSVTLSEISNTAGIFTVNGISKTGTSAIFDNLSAGFYSATFTATATGCTAETTFNIINTNSDLSATIGVTDPLCNGGTVTATITAAGGTSPYTFSLNGGATQPSGVYTNLTAGSYNVLVTDANGCTYNVGFYIAEPTVLVAGIYTHFDVSCNSGTNGSATAFATGGTAPYSYSWDTSPVKTTALATNLSEGIYTVTVTDANNCTSTAMVTINEPALALAISSAVVVNPTCFGGSNGSIDITVSGGTPPYNYAWNNGQATQDANSLTAGNYSVTITDANGCSVTSGTYTLTDPAKIVLTAPLVTNANCDSQENGSVELAVTSGGTSPFTFNLSTGESNTTGVFSTLAAGGYTYTVIDINGCTVNGAFEVDDPNELELSVTDIAEVKCNNGSDGSLTVTATGGTTPYSYQLGTGTPQASGTFGNLTSGIYVVTVTDSKGCSEIETIKISEPTELGIILVNQMNPDCNSSGQIMVSGVGGTAPYVFTSSSGNVSENLISGLTSGDVTITITDKNNCTENLVVTLIDEDQTAPTFTCPATQTLTANANCSATVPDLTALVADETDNCSGAITVTQSIPPGTTINSNITVTVTATDAAGNKTSCDVLLEIEDTTDPVAVCKDVTLQLDMTGRVYISAEDINNGSTDNCGTASLAIDISSFDCSNLGDNTVTLTVTDNAGNISSCTATVTIEDNISPVIDCPAPVTLAADASCAATVPDFVSGLNVSNNCANVSATQSPVAGTVISTGVTSVTITATDGTNTSTCTTTITVVDETAPTFTCPATQKVVADINCQGTLPDLTTLITDATDNCSGDVSITQSIPAGTIINNDIAVAIKVTDNSGNVIECEVLVQIDYPDRPIVSAGDNAEICSTTGAYTLNGTAVDADRIEWSTSGTGTFDDATSLTAVYAPSKADLLDGQIQLTLTAFGAGRCGIVKDEMVLTIWQQATAYAGRNATISPNSNYNIYDATASNYESFIWELIGDGSLLDTQTLTPVFVPNPNQTGTVTLVLSVVPYGEGICETVTDSMTITIGEAPAISFTKRTVSTIIKADGSIEVEFEFSIENKGNVMLSALSLTDNLANTFTGTCSFEIISRLSDNLNLNYDFDGLTDTEILEPNNTLPVGIKKSVLLTVKVQNCDPSVKNYTNVAIARGESPGGSIVNGSDSSEILLYENPSIGLAKQLVSLVLNKDGSYSALFNFRVTNYGDIDLSNIAVYDNLDVVFGMGNYLIEEIYSENFAVNTSFAGAENENLLSSNNKLEVGQSGAVILKVRILSAGNYSNTATATGNNPGGNLFSDTSNNGSDPAPGGGNNPNDFSVPTEIIANDCTVDIICPQPLSNTFNSTPGICGYKITDTGLDASGTASCTDVDVFHDYSAWGNRHSLAGAVFPVGTTIVTWTARDEIGNSVSCTISVTVRDNEAPEFVNCPSGTTFTISLFPGACEGGAVWSIPVAKDNCSEVTVIQTRGPVLGSTLAAGTYQIEYRATDASGNNDFCNFNIKVIDTENPVIVCQPNLKQESDLGKCTWTSTPNSLSPLLANSNCDINITWEVINPDGTTKNGVDDVSGYTFQLGTSTVSYAIMEDGSTQSSECHFTVTIEDKQAPEIICQDDLVITAQPGECSSLVELIPPTVTENCSDTAAKIEYRVFNPDNSISTVIPGTNLSYEFQAGISRIEWMVYDKANNLSFCFQNVWVEIDENSVKPDAGPNSIICESDLFNITEASAPEFAAIKWTTNGTGTFNDPTVVNAVYVPSQSDIANGYAMLTITTTTGCAVASDQMVLTIFKTPVVSAGADAVICETENFQITTNVSSGIQSIEWKTTGTGTFSNPSAQNPIYYPGETDIETGNVELIITGIGAGTCPNVSDRMMLHIERQAIVDAGSDGWICENGDYFLADASVLYSKNVLWTTNGTGSFEDAKQINATYKPSAGDVVNGSVILTITNTTTGQCNTSTDNLVLSISQHPTGNAGGNIATCFEQPITINGAKAENASSVHWSTNGTGILENENTISPTYIPGANEIGTINFQLQITGENACAGDTVVDEIELRIYDKLIVDAGADQTIFFNNSTKLAANVEYGSGKYFYSWQPAGAVFDANAKSTETYNLTSTTDFEITVTDANSQCVASDLVTVFVEEEEDNLLNIFNAFSPNNDGVNDKWIIEGIENFPENNVKFFNRWGDKLREFQNYNNVNSVWDGTNEKGNLVPDGTYFYILTITGSKTYTGWVQIRSVQ